jgi:hypothetical protein
VLHLAVVVDLATSFLHDHRRSMHRGLVRDSRIAVAKQWLLSVQHCSSQREQQQGLLANSADRCADHRDKTAAKRARVARASTYEDEQDLNRHALHRACCDPSCYQCPHRDASASVGLVYEPSEPLLVGR